MGHGRRSASALAGLSDEDLVVLVASRDVDAFETLMNRYRRLISGVCVRMTASQADAEDAVAAVQWAVWRKIELFEGRSKFSTWLYRVAFTTTVGLNRKRVPEPTAEVPDIAPRRTPQDDVVDLAALRWALDQLPAEQRAALIMKECEGLSLEEIAEIQIVAVGTVKSRLSRAREQLVRLLGGVA